jgi:hypothetical protein
VHPLDFLEESEKAFRGGPVVTEAFHFGDEFQLLGDVCHPFTAGDKFGAFWPRSAASASWKSPVEMPRK